MKYLILIIYLLILSFAGNTQSEKLSIFTIGDKLHINLGDNEDFYYTHTIEKNHTMYALSKAYNVTIDKLYSYNNLPLDATIDLGQQINIPLPDRHLYKGVDMNEISEGQYIPVYYTTRPKDNLFRISRVYFKQPTEDLIQRNKLKNNNLDLGQDLLIGWLEIGGQPTREKQVESEIGEDIIDIDMGPPLSDISVSLNEGYHDTLLDARNDSLATVFPPDFNPSLLGTIDYTEEMTTIKKKTVAYWDKSLPDNGSIFALHESALIDSYINIFNPLTRRSVRVKVIGRIPYGTYTNDVKLVISPRTAKQLGSIDRRFKVEVDYLIRG